MMISFSMVCLVLLASFTETSGISCYGRCDDTFDSAFSCQCNSMCDRFGDCCSDYALHCELGSCQGRCGAGFDASQLCQCNSACGTYGDCCSDYDSQCADGSVPTNMDDFANALWSADVNRVADSDVTLNLGSFISDSNEQRDVSPNPLFSFVNTALLQRDTYKTLMALFDNYIPSQGQTEVTRAWEQAEQDAFMDAIFQTDVMNIAYSYVKYLGYYSSLAEYKQFVRGLLFTPYSRKATSDTSGFEHVFVGEWSSSSSVSGFHNWVRMYQLEQEGSMNYYGYMNIQAPRQILYQFEWANRVKPVTSIMYGVSPEFEVAIFSTCFLTNRNARCDMTINGGSASVQTWDYNGADVFGSAYFIA